jgi:photosystem II stability/assembly factor-like uncharacterized protein
MNQSSWSVRFLPLFFGLLIVSITANAQPWVPLQSGTGRWLIGVDFVDGQRGWAVGDTGTIIRTTNGGNTWSPQFSGTTLPLLKVSFWDAQNGIAVGWHGEQSTTFDVIVRTTNGGATWLSQNPGFNLNDVKFVSATTVWGVGQNGRAVKSTNAGVSWTTVSLSLTNIDLTGVYFVNELTGWIAGRRVPQTAAVSVILRTTDGGANWNPSSTVMGPNIDLNDIFFLNTTTGWVAGDSCPSFVSCVNVIKKTTNGGVTWFRQDPITDQSLTAIAFSTSEKGWAVGTFGTLLKTTNGGLDWDFDNSGVGQGLFDLCLRAEQGGWIVGLQGTIVKCQGCGIVPVEEHDDRPQRPSSYALDQNYPNPFNPTSTITFSLPEASHVRLAIYDMMGREIATLVNEQLGAGLRSAVWDSHNREGVAMPSGVYVYEMVARSSTSGTMFQQVRKMILMK